MSFLNSTPPTPLPSFGANWLTALKPAQKSCTIFNSLDIHDLLLDMHHHQSRPMIIYKRTDSHKLWCFCKDQHHSSARLCSMWSYSLAQCLGPADGTKHTNSSYIFTRSKHLHCLEFIRIKGISHLQEAQTILALEEAGMEKEGRHLPF